MPFTNAPAVVQLTMKFNGVNNGWGEKLYLPHATAAAALADAKDICDYRLSFLPSVLELEWATVNKIGGNRERRALPYSFPAVGAWPGVITAPATTPDPLTLWPEKDETCLTIALEEEEGSFSTRFWHGVPDAYANKELALAAITEATTTPPAIGAFTGSETWYQIVGYYMHVVHHRTKMFRERLTPQGVKQLQIADPAAVIYRKLGSHKTGAFFGQSRGRARPR